ncbi:MAG: hypothetical protein BJ554DRAFT_4798 [Olpidium bornovanus]|uniref:Uncharacterized protein n=1 Tax=Olpidium bornovanus TaxID=278681 RepID=A0A8H8DE99_9FUNG|nr:MAG: hypothetical protein BJ554DRAFT_4798 [Olpidium bornovanus]
MFLTATPKQEQKPAKGTHDLTHIRMFVLNDPKLILLYERFQPFHVKADAELAPYNRFEHALPEGFEDLFLVAKPDARDARPAVAQECAEELLKADLAEMKRRGERHGLCKLVRTRGRKLHCQPDLRLLVQEGGVVDAKVPRSDLEAQGISVKLLQFTEDYRPPYWGNWVFPASQITF